MLQQERESLWHHPSNEMHVEDIHIKFFYQPHSICFMLSVMAFLLYDALFLGRDAGAGVDVFSQNACRGLRAVFTMFMAISLITLPNGPFVRPHPAVWRLVLGVSIFYLLGLVFLLFLDYQTVREFLYWLDPELTIEARPLSPEDVAEYSANCAFTFANLWSRFDIFIVAHSAGWVSKALMLRSPAVCWSLSIFWEGTEELFAPLLPNFYECWWDKWIYDVLVCNGAGILIGHLVGKYFEMKQYTWQSVPEIPTIRGKAKRALLQFTPNSWTPVRWLTGTGWQRYLQLTFLFGMVTVVELNTFLLKHIFEVPSKHPLNVWRLVLISMMCLPGIRQYFIYIADPTCKRIGVQCLVLFGIIFIESAISLKFGWVERSVFAGPLTTQIICIWLLCLFAFTGISTFVSVRFDA
eukprot:NODE_8712_length_1474_cov_9.691166.p1 GENE.NODE_8712_length_1474_cov_9.691166~~NODE_8712_length_1474_cov_9.691166.p1  ORF type:complete len:409 (-),score=87.62 NODE_8712_length_1474_cov_9.691166:104-1330(-)